MPTPSQLTTTDIVRRGSIRTIRTLIDSAAIALNRTTDSDSWQDIADDLGRAHRLAQVVADGMAEHEFYERGKADAEQNNPDE
jgi:hypothetical protein